MSAIVEGPVLLKKNIPLLRRCRLKKKSFAIRSTPVHNETLKVDRIGFQMEKKEATRLKTVKKFQTRYNEHYRKPRVTLYNVSRGIVERKGLAYNQNKPNNAKLSETEEFSHPPVSAACEQLSSKANDLGLSSYYGDRRFFTNQQTLPAPLSNTVVGAHGINGIESTPV